MTDNVSDIDSYTEQTTENGNVEDNICNRNNFGKKNKNKTASRRKSHFKVASCLYLSTFPYLCWPSIYMLVYVSVTASNIFYYSVMLYFHFKIQSDYFDCGIKYLKQI